MLFDAIILGCGVITFMVIAILAHELGHAIYMLRTGKIIKLKFYWLNWRRFGIKAGQEDDYKDLTRMELVGVNLYGIVAGLTVIFFATSAVHWIYSLLIVPYLVGCKTDFKIMYGAMKGG